MYLHILKTCILVVQLLSTLQHWLHILNKYFYLIQMARWGALLLCNGKAMLYTRRRPSGISKAVKQWWLRVLIYRDQYMRIASQIMMKIMELLQYLSRFLPLLLSNVNVERLPYKSTQFQTWPECKLIEQGYMLS